jgi:hypothetical protein
MENNHCRVKDYVAVHTSAIIADLGGVGQENWYFSTNTSQFTVGLFAGRLSRSGSGDQDPQRLHVGAGYERHEDKTATGLTVN